MLVIRHSLPGRLRVHIPGLLHDQALAETLTQELQQQPGVLGIDTNVRCGSLTASWPPELALRPDIEAWLSTRLQARICPETARTRLLAYTVRWLAKRGAQMGRQADALLNEPADRAACEACGVDQAAHGRHASQDPAPSVAPWWARIGGFLLLTGYLGYVLVREYLLKRPVAAGALSLTGVVAMVAAIPLLRDAWRETVHERRFTIHQFLAFSLLLAIGFGEALTAFEIIYVLSGGRLLEQWVAGRSRREIRKMLALSVKDTWVLVDDAEVQVPLAELSRGTVVVLRTGEKVPVDGEIVQGEAELSEAAITGRAEPMYKTIGAKVYAGSLLERGMLQVRADSVGDETYLARVAALVDASLSQQSPLEQRADELAARLLKLGAWMTLGTLVLTQSIGRAFTVMLVMSCPCSTILAASTAVSAAIHRAARQRMLVKGGVYLEQLAQADTWCFDKTGTLTTEEPEVAEVIAKDPREMLYWAASAEQHNPHALAHAIVGHATSLGIQPRKHGSSEHILGHGVRADVEGRCVLIGNRRLMDDNQIGVGHQDRAAAELHQVGLTAVYVALDGKLLGLLGVRHRLRDGTRETLARLRADGVRRILLISGDEQSVAQGLADNLGLDACHAELLPEEKARTVATLRAELAADGRLAADGSGAQPELGGAPPPQPAHCGIVMIGDGVNDALALSDADIGIAMGAGGSEVAIEVADIALADSDIHKLVALRELSRATLRTADQNYYLAVGTDLIGIVFGAAGLLSPAMGGLIHIVHTLGILANSSRLLVHKPPGRGPAGDPK